MAEAQRAQTLQSVSLVLIIAGLLLVGLAILLLLSANGGMRGIAGRLRETGKPGSSKKPKPVQRKQAWTKPGKGMKSVHRDGPLAEAQPAFTGMQPAEEESICVTEPLHADSTARHAGSDNGKETEEDTAVLQGQAAADRFRITKKIVITHEKEG